MTFKKIILFILLATCVSANPYLEYESDNLKFDLSTFGIQDFVNIVDNQLSLTIDSKTLIVNLASFSDVILDVSVEQNSPKITLTSNEKTITIKQIKKGETYVYYNKPSQEIIESDIALVYIVEHYSPDKEVADPTREKGIKRLTAVVKDALVEIDNGIIVRTDGLKVNTKSFLEAENFEDKEIDFIGENKLTQIFGQLKTIVINIFNKFKFDKNYDRGFTATEKPISPDLDFGTEFVDVIEDENCDKLGLVYVPGFGYDYLASEFKYTLGIAYSRNDDFALALDDMTEFVNKANQLGLTPIVRILGNIGSINQACKDSFGIDACENEGDTLCNGANIINCNNVMDECNVWQATEETCTLNQEVSNCDGNYCFGGYAYNEIIESSKVADFINKLDQNTDLAYVQIWDNPDNKFTPLEYEEYVTDIKNNIESDVKLISGSISNIEFANSNFDFVATTNLNIETNKQLFFETSSQNKEDLSKLKENSNIKGILISTANYWNKYEKNYWIDDESWIDEESKELKQFAKDVSGDVCK